MATRLLDQLGTSRAMADIRQRVERLLALVGPRGHFPCVLIEGEPGVGKSLLAKAIHEASPRRHATFQSLNCGGLPETLAESELFGHARGAFTGAHTSRPGVFEATRGGVLLLDDIGTLAAGTQPKLLQVIQDREVRRLGGGPPLKVDVWLLAATNERLDDAVAEGRFRRDLRDRLAQITFEIPPLRERREDILPLARYFLGQACSDYDLPPKRFTPEACRALTSHAWPGNVRELSNAVLQIAFRGDGDVVTAELLDSVLTSRSSRPAPKRTERESTPSRTAGPVGRERLLASLEAHGWIRYRVAKDLGIPLSTLRYHIQKHGLRPPAGSAPAGIAPPIAEVVPPPAPDGLPRWEPRSIAALRVVLGSPSGAAPLQPGTVLDLLTERIEALEGQVVDVSPRGLLALFGVARVDDVACRAAHAGLGLLRTIAQEHQPMTAALALHCQFCLVGRAGEHGVVSSEDLAGIRADLDSCLAFSEAGVLVATAETAPYLQRRFVLMERHGAASLVRPVQRVVGPLRVAGEAPDPAPRLFVGRAKEMVQLDHLLGRALSGRGQAVWVTGDAGMGKSRLLAEFYRGLDRAAVRVLEGRCQPDVKTPYLAVGEVVQRLLGVAETDGRPEAEERLRRGLSDLGLDVDALAPVFLDLLGFRSRNGRTGTSPEAFRARVSAAVRDAVLAAAAERPLVLLFEDMHWGDQSSADVVSVLVDAIGSAGVRALLAATYRTGFAPPWLMRSHASQLKLHPLDEADSREIVRGVAGGHAIAHDVVAGVLARADGNPLFLEELARAAAADPRLLGQSVPGTIQEILMARVDRLGTTDRSVLQAASVLGNDFSLEALQALVPDIGGPELEGSLDRLHESELVREKRAAPLRLYSFHHPMTQEVVYASLAPDVRRELHGAVLDTIGGWAPDAHERIPEVMARHLTEAGRAEEAIDAWLRAGRAATRRSANTDAVAHLQKGLGLLEASPPGPERGARDLQLRLALAHALAATKGYGAPEVASTLARAHELCLALGARPHLFHLLFSSWQCQLIRSSHPEAEHLAELLLVASRQAGDPVTRCVASLGIALSRFYTGRIAEATSALFDATASYKDCAGRLAMLDLDQDPGVVAHGFLALALVVRGRLDEAFEPAETALALARGSRHALSLAAGLHLSCLVHQQLGNADRVAAYAAEELAVAREHVLPFWIGGGLFFSGWALARQGKLTEGIARMSQGIDTYDATGAKLGLPSFRGDLASALIAAGDLDRAADVLQLALRQVETQGERSYAAELQRISGDLLLRRDAGLGREAEAHYLEGYRIGCRQAQNLYALRSALGLARVWQGEGRDEPARDLLQSSVALFAGQVTTMPELREARAMLLDLNRASREYSADP